MLSLGVIQCPVFQAEVRGVHGTPGMHMECILCLVCQQSIPEWLALLERFVILLYDRTSSHNSVKEARKQLFTQRGRAMDGLPTGCTHPAHQVTKLVTAGPR